MQKICTICDNLESRFLGLKNGFDVYRCGDCSTIFVNESDGDSSRFDYSNYYDEENLTVPGFVFEVYKDILLGFEPHRGNSRFLDVGCGAGTLLDIAVEKTWDATGVEVSKPAVRHLRDRGLNIIEGTLEDASLPDDYFDVITCTEVIEHVTDPKGLLKEFARVLNPNGILWMTTPHARGLSWKLLGPKWSVVAPPEHLNLFSEKSMKMCLNEAGFENIRFEFTGFNPYEVIQHFRGSSVDGSSGSSPSSANPSGGIAGFERVKKGYQLNEWFSSGKLTLGIKRMINSSLTTSRLGDSMKVWATLD